MGLANPSLEEKPIPCFQNLPDQLTSHKWLHSSPKKWLEVPMMMTPSLNPLMHSKLEAKIDAEMFKHSLMTWGDKFTDTEVDDAFAEFTIEDGQIDAAHLKSLMVAKKEGEEEA